MVYLWEIPDRFPNALIARYGRSNSPDRFLFRKGTQVPESPTVHFEFSGTATELASLDCLPNDAQLPVVGQRALEVINNLAHDDFQPISAIVRTLEGTRDVSFTLLNITRTVTAIDHERSVIDLIPGTSQILGFRKLSCRPDCMGSHALARDAEYRGNILVNEALVKRLRAIGATGIDLKSPESIRW
jgi:hypothetical protein